MIPKLKAVTTVSASLAPAARTASANGTGVDVRGATDILVILTNGTTSGTTPTLDVKIQDSADNSSFSDVTGLTFAQVTAAADPATLQVDPRGVRRYIRAVATIAGTTPSFTGAVLVQSSNREV